MATKNKKTSTNPRRTILILGTGSIGGSIARALHGEGEEIWAAAQSKDNLHQLQAQIPNTEQDALLHPRYVDVLDIPSLLKLEREIKRQSERNTLDAVVYAVGDCPPGGFEREVATPLHELSDKELERNVQLHVTGFLNSCRHFLPLMNERSHIVAVSSAITRLTPETTPDWLHAWHYIASKAALDKLILGFRHNSLVRQKDICVHRVAPAAVDTPFHEGSQHSPPVLVPVHEVVAAVLDVMNSNDAQDREIMPQISPVNAA